MNIDHTHMAKALNLIDIASAQAEEKHGTTELGGLRASLDRKYRIMGEEVGEVSRAIEDHEVANEKRPRVSSWSMQEKRRHLALELAQVGACCQRWLAQMLAEHPEDFR